MLPRPFSCPPSSVYGIFESGRKPSINPKPKWRANENNLYLFTAVRFYNAVRN